MASRQQNREFAESVFANNEILDQAVDWIRENMNPEDVFESKQLADWVESHAKEYWSPSDVFGYDELTEWAESNGFKKEEE